MRCNTQVTRPKCQLQLCCRRCPPWKCLHSVLGRPREAAPSLFKLVQDMKRALYIVCTCSQGLSCVMTLVINPQADPHLQDGFPSHPLVFDCYQHLVQYVCTASTAGQVVAARRQMADMFISRTCARYQAVMLRLFGWIGLSKAMCSKFFSLCLKDDLRILSISRSRL